MTHDTWHLTLKNALIVVAKRPAPGQTKTRLTPPLPPEQAAALYECFLLDTLDLVRQLEGVQPVMAYLPPGAEAYFRRLAPDFELAAQSGENLGARLDNITTRYLQQGYPRVVVMDSDSPTLPAEYLAQAFEVLAGDYNVALGPCDDGGYYLIGLNQPAPRLLREVHMSTPDVFAETMALAAEEKLKVRVLPVWYDIDDLASLVRLRDELTRLPADVARHTRCIIGEITACSELLSSSQP